MDFPFSFGQKSTLLLIFFFHGIVFSFLVLRKGIIYNNPASKWLSVLLFLSAMYIAPHMLGYAGWYSKKYTREILFFIPFMQVLLIGPVVYFYTKSLLDTTFKLTGKDWIHFVPALVYAIYSLVVFVVDKLVLDTFYFYADGRDKDLANWYQAIGVISMGFYLILSLRYYAYYKVMAFNTVSYADAILYRWIKNFMIAFLAILILRILFFIINPGWGAFGSQFWYYIAFSLVFYYISINGYSNSVKHISLAHEKMIPIFHNEKRDDFTALENKSPELTLEPWKIKLSELMSEKRVFENPRLTLSDVANELETTTKTVSSVVNSVFKMNFNDFVNHYRVEAVKDKLNKGEHTKNTLLGIAIDCGFNSKATFNRAFKKSTSLSPKNYIEKHS